MFFSVLSFATFSGTLCVCLAPTLSHFLKRDVKKAVAEVTEDRVNDEVSYGLEILYVYRFYGPKAYIDRILRALRTDDISFMPCSVACAH